MELVEGPTLGEQIALAPIPPEDVLSIARQIAEALEAAHEQGIVHRDLKPANVKVKPDGMVKVLDFGLAKLVEASGAGGASQAGGLGGLSMSPTITTPAMTQMGMILGTAAYMSPEQARGAPADRRADVWAFGCVVYEMLTGRAVFEGKTVSDVLAGVLRIDPEWQRLPAAIHPRLRLMLERCLARDARDRYQGISDARVDVEVAQNDPGGATLNAASRHDRPSRSLVRRGAALALAAAVGAALAVVGMLATRPDSVEPSALQIQPVSARSGAVRRVGRRDSICRVARRPHDCVRCAFGWCQQPTLASIARRRARAAAPRRRQCELAVLVSGQRVDRLLRRREPEEDSPGRRRASNNHRNAIGRTRRIGLERERHDPVQVRPV
jgi:hypothetical protein